MVDEGAKASLRKKFSEHAALGFIAALAAYLIIGLLIGLVLYWFVAPNAIQDASKAAQAKRDMAQALAFLMAGLAGAIGVYFTWQSLNQTRESTQKTLQLTAQGQITERFTSAINQLGEMDHEAKPKLEVRIGGIYALDRIAADAPDPYRNIVAEALTAYVRYCAPWSPMEPSTSAVLPIGTAVRNSASAPPEEPRFDIQVVLNIVGKPCYTDLDLRRANLQGAHLNETDLEESRLFRSNLQGARLINAKLQRADLEEADLGGANLQGANLQGANLQGANLQGANLQGAILKEASLQGANLQGANLKGANLRQASLQKEKDYLPTNLQGAILYSADLKGANLREADLKGANLKGAKLQEVILKGAYPSKVYFPANLQGAKLQGADLQGAKLQGADLSHANLTGAKVTKDQLDAARSLGGAKLPEDLAYHYRQSL